MLDGSTFTADLLEGAASDTTSVNTNSLLNSSQPFITDPFSVESDNLPSISICETSSGNTSVLLGDIDGSEPATALNTKQGSGLDAADTMTASVAAPCLSVKFSDSAAISMDSLQPVSIASKGESTVTDGMSHQLQQFYAYVDIYERSEALFRHELAAD